MKRRRIYFNWTECIVDGNESKNTIRRRELRWEKAITSPTQGKGRVRVVAKMMMMMEGNKSSSFWSDDDVYRWMDGWMYEWLIEWAKMLFTLFM